MLAAVLLVLLEQVPIRLPRRLVGKPMLVVPAMQSRRRLQEWLLVQWWQHEEAVCRRWLVQLRRLLGRLGPVMRRLLWLVVWLLVQRY